MPTDPDKAARELVRLRREQAARAMPLIGPLLDAWDETPSDLKSEIEYHAPALSEALDEILSAMEGTDAD